mmetsp:Transcript_30571/g.86442  ORF Transcript_30571/g.86442 Transcript_30571/m.86442 type:complete len:247 (+) Transcript_30571:736-1476(+)
MSQGRPFPGSAASCAWRPLETEPRFLRASRAAGPCPSTATTSSVPTGHCCVAAMRSSWASPHPLPPRPRATSAARPARPPRRSPLYLSPTRARRQPCRQQQEPPLLPTPTPCLAALTPRLVRRHRSLAGGKPLRRLPLRLHTRAGVWMSGRQRKPPQWLCREQQSPVSLLTLSHGTPRPVPRPCRAPLQRRQQLGSRRPRRSAEARRRRRPRSQAPPLLRRLPTCCSSRLQLSLWSQLARWLDPRS